VYAQSEALGEQRAHHHRHPGAYSRARRRLGDDVVAEGVETLRQAKQPPLVEIESPRDEGRQRHRHRQLFTGTPDGHGAALGTAAANGRANLRLADSANAV